MTNVQNQYFKPLWVVKGINILRGLVEGAVFIMVASLQCVLLWTGNEWSSRSASKAIWLKKHFLQECIDYGTLKYRTGPHRPTAPLAWQSQHCLRFSLVLGLVGQWGPVQYIAIGVSQLQFSHYINIRPTTLNVFSKFKIVMEVILWMRGIQKWSLCMKMPYYFNISYRLVLKQKTGWLIDYQYVKVLHVIPPYLWLVRRSRLCLRVSL